MKTRYKFIDNNAVYFTTSTVVGWTDIFTREMYKIDSVRHCQQSQGLKIHAWAPIAIGVTNPAWMTGRTGICITICSCKEGHDVGLIWRNIKSFTAMKLIDAVTNNSKESRKEYLLHTFAAEGKKSSSNFKHKFWEHENHPVLLDCTAMYNQRLNYLPARQAIQAGIVPL